MEKILQSLSSNNSCIPPDRSNVRPHAATPVICSPAGSTAASSTAPQRPYGVLDDFGDPKASFHSRLEPSSCGPKEREVHIDAHECQNLFATWSSYPEIGNGITIPAIYDDVRSDNYPHKTQKTQSQDLPVSPWCWRGVNTQLEFRSATFGI